MVLKNRIPLITAVVLGFLSLGDAAIEAQPPSLDSYRVYVARADQYTRCGPGEDFYRADPLQTGEVLDVYRETEDGWLGIRPPENSFCWVQSEQIEVDDAEATGVVVDSSAVAWIGTHLGRARKYRWQIRLQEGETVTIIGTAKREGPEGRDVWYRIVPPPGEFRWVHVSQVVESPLDVERAPAPPQQIASQTPIEQSNEGYFANRQNELRSADATNNPSTPYDEPIGSGLAQRDAAETGPRSLNELLHQSRPDPPSANEAIVSNRDVAFGNRSQVQPASDWVSGSGLRESRAPELAELPPTPLKSLVGPPRYKPNTDIHQASADSLRDELSRAMAASARAFEVEPLRQRAANIAVEAANSIDRGRAAILLKRIEEYQLIASRRDQSENNQVVRATATEEVTSPESTPRSIPSVITQTVSENLDQDRGAVMNSPELQRRPAAFDRQGWLVRVYSSRPNSPPYAITDADGRTLSYVTPVPGINLKRFLNQQIGLYGRMAQDTSLATPHMIVEQAVRLRR